MSGGRRGGGRVRGGEREREVVTVRGGGREGEEKGRGEGAVRGGGRGER